MVSKKIERANGNSCIDLDFKKVRVGPSDCLPVAGQKLKLTWSVMRRTAFEDENGPPPSEMDLPNRGEVSVLTGGA
jgi:hypothetical protein